MTAVPHACHPRASQLPCACIAPQLALPIQHPHHLQPALFLPHDRTLQLTHPATLQQVILLAVFLLAYILSMIWMF